MKHVISFTVNEGKLKLRNTTEKNRQEFHSEKEGKKKKTETNIDELYLHQWSFMFLQAGSKKFSDHNLGNCKCQINQGKKGAHRSIHIKSSCRIKSLRKI